MNLHQTKPCHSQRENEWKGRGSRAMERRGGSWRKVRWIEMSERRRTVCGMRTRRSVCGLSAAVAETETATTKKKKKKWNTTSRRSARHRGLTRGRVTLPLWPIRSLPPRSSSAHSRLSFSLFLYYSTLLSRSPVLATHNCAHLVSER